ncbi:MAG: hypothetical protein IPG04_28680 [Polyangiaceae bacterium]|nr:hypothetical protein [Polyangiaceae bacterium]
MVGQKKRLAIEHGERSTDIAFYEGTSRAELEQTIRAALGMPPEAQLVLRDADGDVVALSDALPSGSRLRVETDAVAPAPAPAPAVRVAPGPRAYPVIGNLTDLAHEDGLNAAFARLVREHGDFVRLKIRGNDVFLCADADVVGTWPSARSPFRSWSPSRTAR